MHESDYGPFEAAFKRLSGALQKRWKPDEWREVVKIYFDALKHAELSDVLAAVTTLQARNRWPKTGDWLAALPIRTPVPAGGRVMRLDEVDIYMNALRLHYHGEPCRCLLCQSAGVTDLPLRFVPDFTPEDTEERAFCPALNRLVVVGHWAHGQELRRWYLAKAGFASSAPAPYRHQVLALVTREPGEDG